MPEITSERMKEIAEQLGINLQEGETVSEEMLQELLSAVLVNGGKDLSLTVLRGLIKALGGEPSDDKDEAVQQLKELGGV